MAESSLPIMNVNKKLTGKVAIITGGASGIGEETARLFAERGARMVVIADIQDELGQQVAASIGAHCIYKHCDVTDEEQVQSLVEMTVQNFGQLDIMFSNAGIISKTNQTVIDLDLSWFDRLMAVNSRGMAACVKHAARAMVAGRDRGSIVCMTSVMGQCGVKRLTDYSMSKHAVIGLMKSASLQLGEHGIRVNCVSPSGILTPITSHLFVGMKTDEIVKIHVNDMCLKGAVLKKINVAEAVLFLASNDSELITGHNLVVDGGFLLNH